MGKLLRRYWGYIALALAVVGWVTHTLGYAAILIASILAFVYFLVQAPLTCGAEIRGEGKCRNNSHGILVGCWVRQHKWQRAKGIFISRKWRDIAHNLWAEPKDKLATVGGLISIISVFATLPLIR
jgi:hypothetical protein